MNANRPRLVRNSPEEEAEINRQIAENPDEAEWTDEDWAYSNTTQELFPEAYEWHKQRRAALEAGLIERVTITLDRETIDWFKAQTGEDGETSGTRWMMLLEKTLRQHAQREMQPQVGESSPTNQTGTPRP